MSFALPDYQKMRGTKTLGGPLNLSFRSRLLVLKNPRRNMIETGWMTGPRNEGPAKPSGSLPEASVPLGSLALQGGANGDPKPVPQARPPVKTTLTLCII